MLSGKLLRILVGASCAGLLLPACRAADIERTFTIREPFGLAWGPERVSEIVEFPEGAVRPDGVALRTPQGQPVAAQLADVEFWPDGKSVRRARLHWLVTLAPGEQASWTLSAGRGRARQPDSGLKVRERGGTIELSNARAGIRLVGGAKTFPAPVAAAALPPPIQGVRLHDGAWVGQGSWQTDLGCTGYRAEVLAEGPVFASVRLRYEFEGGKFYQALIELTDGQDLAIIREEFNLSEGKRYPMSGVNGMKPDVQYGYVYPSFATPERALVWDWWGQTMAVLPTPNAYLFSCGEGLRPDSAEFHGRSQYGNLKEGDGGLTFDKDGRFAYLNAYLQWGDEESLYLGLYNSQAPARMLAAVALLPSQWLHPDIDPHPDNILKQYVQTNCITFERRRGGEVFFRAPVCLGKRVYGLGGVERTLARHVIPDRSGPRLNESAAWGSDLMLRHVRLGRLPLDTARNWVLDYDEPSPYPRLFVPAGDRVLYESRRTRKPVEAVREELAARTGPTAAERQAVTDALARSKAMVLHFAQIDKGHMDFGIEEGILSDLAEDALASPACTPEQARELRGWLAAITYFALHPDFVPPRTAGFAWGSANMMAQVQCRACRIAALLPNHPQGKAWRRELAQAVTLYAEDQINAAGATLECPHYGTMAIIMPVLGLAALANCGDADLGRAAERMRAAAGMRLGTLLPPDVRGGYRSQCPEGDGYYAPESVFAPLAGFFQKTDPQLARMLAWGVRECNNDLGGHSDSAFKLFDVGVAPLEPALGSAHYPGYGFVMRNGFPRADEAHLQVYAGDFSWGHGHTDRGSWVLYAKGAPLMMDFAAMYTPSMREQWLHPGGLSFNHDETVRPAGTDPKDAWWRESADPDYRTTATAPFTVVEMRADPNATDDLGTFGRVTAFHARPQADYAEMQRRLRYLHRVPYLLQPTHGKDLFNDGPHEEVWLQQPFTWTRRFVFVKDADPLGHNYLVVRDELPGNTEVKPSLNLWCLADKLDVQGQLAHYRGQHGVDLHCYVAEPAAFTPQTRTVGHPCGFGFAQHYKQTFGKDFREDQIQLRIPQASGGGGYFVALVPVKQGEAAPKFETVAGGKAVRVTFTDGRTDTIVLRRDAEPLTVDGQAIAGNAVLVSTKDGKTTVTDLATAP